MNKYTTTAESANNNTISKYNAAVSPRPNTFIKITAIPAGISE